VAARGSDSTHFSICAEINARDFESHKSLPQHSPVLSYGSDRLTVTEGGRKF
jgi:hypothetical protein